MTDQVRAQRDLARLVCGLAVILVGILFTLDNLHVIHAEKYLSYWPVVLVAIGVIRIVQSSSWMAYGWSLVWIVVGLWLLGENIGLISASIWTLWPLVLVLVGATIVWRGCCPPQFRVTRDHASPGVMASDPAPSPSASTPARDSFVRAVAVMGAVERASASADFRGADLVAFMGGCELDLRHATIAGDEAVVDVMALMGGIEIYIPDNWAVEAKVLPLMGGVGDETRLARGGPTKRLVIRGLALMGGVEIKN